jgi:cell division protease FtsH
MPPTGTPPNESPANRPSPVLAMLFIAFAIVLVAVIAWTAFSPSYKTISFDRFAKLIETGNIGKLTLIGKDQFNGEVRNQEDDLVKSLRLSNGRFSVILPPSNDLKPLFKEIQDRDAEANKEAISESKMKPVQIDAERDQGQFFGPVFWAIIPTLILIGIFLYMMRSRDSMGGGGMFNSYVKSPARRYERNKNRTTFEDVAGMDGTKSELKEVVEFLKTPEKFQRLGAEVPKGVLLVGPPGTGKTLLARAVAGEAGVPFYSINGSEFIQMFVGVGASRVRDLFKTAKENAPCLIFIDEIDAVGRMRGAGVGGGSDEREQTLNQILSEMDGFQATETIIVIAATNRPDVLDSALLRPGRFDRHVTVDRPTWQGRFAILKVHTRNKPLADDVDLEKIARSMIGMSGADLRNLANEAALSAAREDRQVVKQGDFDRASDRIRMGPRREEIIMEDEKRRTAYHEAGHALCAWLEPESDPLVRVSILPRGRAGGVTLFQPDEDRIDESETELIARLVVTLGGRAADRLIFGEPRTGATSDLKYATRVARMMVTQFGMSERLGPVSYRVGEEHVFLGKEIAESRDFSEGTAELIDQEVQRILRDADDKAYQHMLQHRDKLEQLTDALMVHEEMNLDQIETLFRDFPRPKPSTNGVAPKPVVVKTTAG